MDFSHYSDQPVQTAVDLVNTFDSAAAHEKLSSTDTVATFISTHGDEWQRLGWEPTERDLHEVRALRTRLRQVFEASDEAAAATVLNEILADVQAVPRVSVHGPGPHLHFESEADRLSRYLGAVTAMGLSVALIEGGFERFGMCQASNCADVFVDTSKNRSRLHCSDTCTTRENVAAHRARQRDRQ